MTFPELQMIESLDACSESLEWLSTQSSAREAWTHCEDSRWMMWLLQELEIEPKLSVKIALECAWPALQYVPVGEERPMRALECVERWLYGTTTREELLDAADAARSAAYSAARSAAYSAASAAADAAADAADAAAAYSAAYAASAAASAAYSADVAYSADAADAAARKKQCDIIRSIVAFETVEELLNDRAA